MVEGSMILESSLVTYEYSMIITYVKVDHRVG
jgi:hypothetical protein